MRYIGFDIGDGESAVSVYEQGSGIEPVILPVCGARSLLSAVGLRDGDVVIGEQAYTGSLAGSLSVRFKSRFTTDAAAYEDIVRFVHGAVRDLENSGQLTAGDRFFIGCPAGWNAACRARYRELLQRAGIRDPQVISESRAAFLYAKYAKTVALDVDILNESALVADIGSSTLDYAYIVDGRETGVGTFGETALGGGVLDAAILRRAVEKSPDAEEIRSVFEASRSWYSYCEIESRRLKEEYFTRLSAGEDPVVRKQIRILYDRPVKLTVSLDAQEIAELVEEPLTELYGRSFRDCLKESFAFAAKVTRDRPPRLLLLTGGASRMPFFRDLARGAFPGAVVICCPEPEFSIAKGLAYAGWVDDNLAAFREAVRDEVTDERVSAAAQQELGEFIPELVDRLTDVIIDDAVLPAAERWKNGELETLNDLNTALSDRVQKVLSSPETGEALSPVITRWVAGLSDNMQAMVDPICDRFHVPRKQMKLNLTAVGGGKVSLNAGEWMGLSIVGTVMGVLMSVIGALVCGGGGLALISAGPLGLIAGACIGAAAAFIGWGPVSGALMKAKVPALLRKGNMEKRLKSKQVRRQIYQSLYGVMADEDSLFRRKLVEGFSSSFRGYLYSIAQAAEIPII